MKYYPIELHAHTCHSDGDFSIHQLIQAAKEEPYQVLTVTDHNTFAPYEQWRKEKLEQNQQDDFDGNLLVVPGIEWTTFYGHMLVIGANQVIDWRQAQKRSLDPQLRQIKAAQGIVGIAHPFSIGSPICTGCHVPHQMKIIAVNWLMNGGPRCCYKENVFLAVGVETGIEWKLLPKTRQSVILDWKPSR